jgi:hypothetical protein
MKRFAVAYMYQEIPHYDTIRLLGDKMQYFRGDILVAEISRYLELETKLGLNLIDAMDSAEAIQKAILVLHYHIEAATALEV